MILVGQTVNYKCVGAHSLELCKATVIATYRDSIFAVNSDDVTFILDISDVVKDSEVELWQELAEVIKIREAAEKREAAIRRVLR